MTGSTRKGGNVKESRHDSQSAGSSAPFHDGHEAQAGAALPPWTGSPCEQPESPRCWRIKPETEQGHEAFYLFVPKTRSP